jgi:uncharacterized protein (TIGR02646 family)
MLFIEKTKPPRSLIKFIALQKSASLHPSYSDLRSPFVEDLDRLLFEQQKGLCCYCMQALPTDTRKRTREHFLPQSKFKQEEVNYYNLYLACTERDGTNSGHCDKTKGDILISKYIGHPNCGDFFKYNDKGEILPQKLSYEEWEKFKTSSKVDIFETSPETAELLATISILKLNAKNLKEKREQFIKNLSGILAIISTKQDCQVLIDKYQNSNYANPKPFLGVALYFLKQRLKQLA